MDALLSRPRNSDASSFAFSSRALLIALACLSFCSCQALQTGSSTATAQREPARLAPAQAVGPMQRPQAAYPQGTYPPGAYPPGAYPQPAPGRPVTTASYYPAPLPHVAHPAMVAPHQHQHTASCPCCGPKGPFAFSDVGPLACGPGGACGHGACADGACGYRPYDEYICDGGDNYNNAHVRRDWKVFGLEQEDTIVHFDTLDGRTEHSASNKVCLYAPRFAAVRQVRGLESSEQADRLAAADKSLPPVIGEELKIVSDINQPQQPVADLGIKGAQSYLERQKGLTAETTRHLTQIHLDLLPYENLDMIRRGVMQNNEKLRLAQVAANAVVWTREEAVQVVVDKKLPLEAVRDTQLGETVMYDRQGKPRMRICKIADKSEAQPGDIVSFTLRFDNVGEQKVGNVTIIDNLTTRLEYVEGSQECSHKANFVTTLNDGETLVLKWEIEDPLRVGEGGIIRFKCRVR